MFGNRACREVESLLWNYAARRVSEEDRERVETHLETCSKCGEQAEGYRRTLGALAAYQDQTAPSSQTNWQDLQARLAAKNPTPAPVGFRWRLPALAWGGASVAVVAGLLLFVLPLFRTPEVGQITFKPVLPDSHPGSKSASENPPLVVDNNPNFSQEEQDRIFDDLDTPPVETPVNTVQSVGRRTPRASWHRRRYRASRYEQVSTPTQHEVQFIPAADVDGGRSSHRTDPENFVMSPVGFANGQEDSPNYVMGSVGSSRRSNVSSYEEARGW
jgi:hypothetical protein